MKKVTGGNDPNSLMMGGDGEDNCSVRCHDGSGTFTGKDCVDVAWKNCKCPQCGYSCGNSCFD